MAAAIGSVQATLVRVAPCAVISRSLSSGHDRDVVEGAGVKLINTDGMAFIGTGSEWFWTALSGMILAVTFIAIYRQLRQQAHASAIEMLDEFDRVGESERFGQSAVETLIALRDGADPAVLPDGAEDVVADAWGRWATLARAGHRDTKLLWQWNPRGAQVWWGLLASSTRKWRAESGNPTYLQDFEWLAGVMAAMDRRAGRPAVTPAYVTSRIDGMLAHHQRAIRVAQALRTVILPSPEAVTVAQPAVVAPPA